MKSWLLSCLIFLGAAVARADETTTPIQGPSIACDEPVYDFGTADNRTVIEHTFILKNVGDTTLEISNTRAACGCTVANVSTKTIPPGGTSELTSRLNLQGRRGQQHKTITISSNDPEKPNFVVTLAGNATASLSVIPERLMFGQLNASQEIILPVEIQNVSETPLEILGIETENDHLHVEQEVIEGGKHFRLKVKLKAGLQAGTLNSVVRVKTSSPERPVLEIPVYANIVGELLYAPQEIVLPAQAEDSALTRYIVVRAGSSGSFQITGVELPDPDMKHTILPFGGQGYRIQIENIVPNASLNGSSVKILTSAASMPQIDVPLRIAQ